MRCRECSADLPAEARFCLSCGARVAPKAEAPADPLRESLDKAIGFQYRIERLLGRGGMGAVYLAHELALERDVAIKVLPPEQASTPELRERFKREARTAARLTHPNIVPLHTFGEVAGLMYFVMGYVAGESLRDRLKRQGAFDSESARLLLASVCDALDYAHKQGIVHRDIKPDNILIDGATGGPLLMDFGIAKAPLGDAQLTTDGQLLGTPHYMSPEQALGRTDVGPRSDLYSLGVVAYEMVSAQRPFEATTAMEAVTQRLTHEPRPLASVAGHVPGDMAQAITRCLQKDPDHRWPDARSLREALLPSDEEPENTFHERLLRISTSLLLLALVVEGYATVFTVLTPGLLSPRASRLLRGMPIGVAAPMVLAWIVAAVRLRAQEMDLGSVVRKAFQQPPWWGGWYPRRFRRRGDMWDRLPRELRLFRSYRAACLVFVFGVFVPLQLASVITGSASPVRTVVIAVMIALMAGMVLIRRRATARIKSTLAITDAEASRLLNTPPWRTTVWRKPSTAALLVAGAAEPAGKPAAASPAADADEGKTHISAGAH
jgi:serine/threonine protein kinase